MSSQSEQHDVAVVGGGVIGLAVAWRAAQRGLRTLVLDAGEDGAWRYAAGMLAPVTEAEFGEQALLDLGLRAAAGFPDFCAELEQASGRDPGLRLTGTLVVARDRDEAEELDQLYAYRQKRGPRGRAAPAHGRAPRRARARADRPARARRARRRRRRPAQAGGGAVRRRRGRGRRDPARPRDGRRRRRRKSRSSSPETTTVARSTSSSPPAPGRASSATSRSAR